MLTQFSRTGLLIGENGIDRLRRSRVAVFGIGGVGGYVCEALVRSGIGAFDLIDNDTVCLTNLNRQIIATRKTVGRYKVDVMKERMLEIDPDVRIRTYKAFVLPENAGEFPFADYDYVIDAVDTVTAKMRRELRKRGVGKLKVVYSEEEPIQIPEERIRLYRDEAEDRPDADHISAARRSVPGSTAFVPSVAGLIIAGEVVKDLAFGS